MKKKKKSIMYILLVLIFIAIIIIGYMFIKKSNKENEKDQTTTTTTAPIKKLKIVNENSKSRPYAIMINNVDGARKLQSGLQDAYIIYELLVEGGITRYLALFMDQNTERIGSIRSARHYYLDYALENDAIYVHHGYSPQAQSDWKTLGVDRIEVSESSTGWRDKSASNTYEYTLFTNIEKLQKGIGSKRTERNKELLLNYSIDELNISDKENATPANDITIKYSSGVKSQYKYDSEQKVYLKSTNGNSQNDYVTKEQLKVKNIITYKVKYTSIEGDHKGRKDMENIGSGEGYYITNGYSIPIKWSKKSRKEQTKYTYMDGTELVVNDGNTFIHIQPSGQDLTIE